MIERARIRRAWSDGGQTRPWLCGCANSPGSRLDLSTLNRCVAAANEAGFVQWLSGGQCTVSAADLTSGPDGPVVVLGLAESREGLLGWLTGPRRRSP